MFCELKYDPHVNHTTFITPLGTAVLEIQGELHLPDTLPSGTNTSDLDSKFRDIPSNIFDNTSKSTQESNIGIKFGKLELEGKKATLFIGTTQRLIGDLKPVNPPLGLLKLENGEAKIVDVIKWKAVFVGRPLPVM